MARQPTLDAIGAGGEVPLADVFALFDTPEARRDPFPIFATMRSAGGAFRTSDGIWLTTSWDASSAVLCDPDTSSAVLGTPLIPGDPGSPVTQLMSRWVSLVDPPNHTRMRTVMSPAFGPHAVKRLRPGIDAFVHERIERVVAAGRMDVMADLAQPVPAHTLIELIGVPHEDGARVHDWAHTIITGVDPGQGTASDAAARAVEDFGGYLTRLCDQRGDDGEDLISTWMRGHKGATLTREELVANVLLVLTAGQETTAYTIGSGLLELIEAPGALEYVRDNPDRTDRVVEEIFRHADAAQLAIRRAGRDLDVGDAVIRSGELVIVVQSAANRDPRRWDDPETFDVTREPIENMGSSAGLHYCLGAQLSRAEVAACVRSLAERCHNPKLLVDRADLEPTAAVNLRGVESLPISFDPVG